MGIDMPNRVRKSVSSVKPSLVKFIAVDSLLILLSPSFVNDSWVFRYICWIYNTSDPDNKFKLMYFIILSNVG